MTKYFKNNKMNFKTTNSNMIYLFFMILSTMITINSSSWINAWMGMEINLLSFMPLMMNNSKNKIASSMMIYFIIQASASSMILFFILMMKTEFNLIKMNMILIIIQISLMMKLGAAPLHWWMPKITIKLSWINCFFLLTWQKIAPLFLISISSMNLIMYTTSMSSVITGALLGLNQTSLKLILTYSSINHLGWMLMLMMLNLEILMFYFWFYFLINWMICLYLNIMNYSTLTQMFKNNKESVHKKIISMSMFLSLGGMPPMLGFLPKFFSLELMMNNSLYFESAAFIIMATISLSFYMNSMMSMFLFTKINTKWNNKKFTIFSTIISILILNILMNSVIIIYYSF
uniref:NADH-ubiquinone oxidoreductase chain 2 n=1 Tax=Birmella discoidalisa TaxID=2060665 RepID=A0A2H4ZQR6_9HYME|nr:NADH dehydrogenase subunit 2 [Birmella discoidalisa]